MNSDELPLDIRLKPLAEFFSCPVCMCTMEDVHMTLCGHRFCENCIKESVSRHHKCPCCNKPLELADLIRDHQFDGMLKVVTEEKEKSEQRYYHKLFQTVAESTSEDEFNTPIKDVLKKHLMGSLIAHEKYFKDLKIDCKRRVDEEEKKCGNLMIELQAANLPQEEFERQQNELRISCMGHQEALQADLETCCTLLAGAYDRHLEEHLPDTSVLPLKVTVTVLAKTVSLPSLTLRPHDPVSVIREHIENYMEIKGDRIIKYGPDVRFVYFGPFSRRTQYEMHQAASDIVQFGATHPDIFILPETSRPVLQFKLKPGSEIALYGMVQCESDLPKQCFVSTFNPGAGNKVDYFSCKDCGFNWVCRSCMEVCHKDHNMVPYIMDHQPTWACCYCPKKKKCVLKIQ